MKKLLTSIFLMQLALVSFSQDQEKKDSLEILNGSQDLLASATGPEEAVRNFSEVMPEYPGGINELRKEVAMHYRIPYNYLASGGQGGLIITRFVIETNGRIGDVTILKGIDDCRECNVNAKRAILSIPKKFTPGSQKGKPVRVYYTLPISINIAGDTSSKKKK